MSEFFNSIKDRFDDLPTWGKVAIGVAAVGGSLVIFAATDPINFFRTPRSSPIKKDFKPGVVYLYQFPPSRVIPSVSPFALKLETWLRIAGVNYENVDGSLFTRSKEGTIPFVELNGKEYCDSMLIIRDLTKLLRKESVEGAISVEQRATSRAYEQMVDNVTFLTYGYVRLVEKFADHYNEKISGYTVPWVYRLIMPYWRIAKHVKKRLYYHGLGRHSRDEILNIGFDDLRCISAYLGTKQFFHGDTPTRVDAAMFGTLAQMIYIPVETPHQNLINTELKNLVRYCDRIKARFWPDWDEIGRTLKWQKRS